MSRIGKLPVAVPSGVDVTVEASTVTVKGPKGTLSHTVAAPITVGRADDGALEVKRPDDERNSQSLHGLTRTLIANMVTGVTDGYEKKLEIVGVGYRVLSKGPTQLEFQLGYSHSITFNAPDGHHLHRRRARPGSASRASTSSSSARSLPTSASCASPSPTRARASATRASTSAARSERLVSDMAIALKAHKHTATARRRGCVARSGAARRSPARPSVRGSWSPAPRSTSPSRSSTTWSARRSRRRPPWRPTCARSTATRPPRPSKVGELVAERAKAAGVDGVVFDRAGNKYHGRVAALADGAREGGLTF